MPIGLILAIGGIVASPVLWFAVSFLCANIPMAATFLSRFFWESLGNIPVFETAAKILEEALAYRQFTGTHFVLTFVSMLASSVMDSLIMGICMFVIKSIFARFTRQGLLMIPANGFVTVLGITFGVIMTMSRDVLPEIMQGGFSFLLCAGLILLGMGTMLGKPIRTHYISRRSTALAGMLMRILVDANLAWCCVSLAVCTLEGPSIVQSTGSLKMWALWYGCTLLLYFVLDSAIFFLSPSIRNSL